jgi:hypothetical protein
MKFKMFRLGLGITAVLAITLIFNACNLFDKADDITFPSQLEVVWSINEQGEHTDFAYQDLRTLKLSDDPEIEKYINKIKDVKVEKVTYHITDYAAEGDAVFFKNGVASFAAGSGSNAVTVPFAATASGVNLETTTGETELEIDAQGLNDLAATLKQEKEVDMNAAGVLSKTPVSFKIVSTFHVKITAEVLD